MKGHVMDEGPRVLIVADSDRWESVQAVLRRAGIAGESEVVHTPGLLVTALREGPWDLIVYEPDFAQLRVGVCLALILASEPVPPVIVVAEPSRGFDAEGLDEDMLFEKGIQLCDSGQLLRTLRQTVREIALRRELERLQDRQERCLEILDRLPDFAYTHDGDGCLTFLNRTAERVGGYAPGELIGRNFADIVAPECLELARRGNISDVGPEEPTVYELEVVAKDGARVPVEITSWLIIRDGKPTGNCGIARMLAPQPGVGARSGQERPPVGRRRDVQAELHAALEELHALGDSLAEDLSRDELRRILETFRASVQRIRSLAPVAFDAGADSPSGLS